MKINNSVIRKKGDRQSGAAAITAVLFFVFFSSAIILGMVMPVMAYLSISFTTSDSLKSFVVADAAAEDAVYRLRQGMQYENTYTFSMDDGSAEVAIDDSGSNTVTIESHATVNDQVRKTAHDLTIGDGVAFRYGMQAGDGGVVLRNSAKVVGNVFSSGPISGQGNVIEGSAVSAGVDGLIDDVETFEGVHAHTVEDSLVGGDAHYQELINTVVDGESFPDSEDSEPQDLPLSDETIDGWKQLAADTEVVSCSGTHTINTDTTLGPVHITCDLEIRQSPEITFGGHVWVEGDIIIRNSPIFSVDDSLGDESVAVIADNPANRTTSSQIELRNSAEFRGAAGSDSSYVLFISQNESAEQGGSEVAITVEQSVFGDLLVYTNRGEIRLDNSINLKEVTAWRIRAVNTAEVVYETGLASTLFSSGPGGGYVFSRWEEIQ